jgi:hypothetical protein
MLRTPSLLLLLLVASLSTACGTLRAYSGAPRGPSEVASLRPATVRGHQILIEAVDGQALSLLQDRAELLPGSHRVRATLVLRTESRLATGTHELEFEAEPGRQYRVHGDWYIYGPRIWISEEGREEVLAVAVTRPARPRAVGAGR